MHHDDDHDCDIEIHLNPFLLITVGDAFIRRMADIADEQFAEAFAAGASELESEPTDLYPVLELTVDPTLNPPGRTPVFAHPPIFPPRERLSGAATLGYQHLLDELNQRVFGALGLPASAFDGASSGSVSGASLPGSIVRLENIGPDGDTAYLVSPEGIAFVGMEVGARTWADHGELFELPNGWRFQDNMIQGSLGEPGDNLFAVITYDADNLPNPWEWQLHEAASSDPNALWEEVPTSTDKPRAGWAPSLLAAMTRARTAGALHLDDRRAAAGGA